MISIKTLGGVSYSFPDFIFSTTRVCSVDGNYVTIDGIMFDLSSLKRLKDTEGNAATAYQDITDLPFDGNRIIKRDGLPLINPKTDTVKNFLDVVFYPKRNAVFENTRATPLQNIMGKEISLRCWSSLDLRDEKDPIISVEIKRLDTDIILLKSIQTGNSINVTQSFVNDNNNIRIPISFTFNFKSIPPMVLIKEIQYYYPGFSGMLDSKSTQSITPSTLKIVTEYLPNTIIQQDFIMTGEDKYVFMAVPCVEIAQSISDYRANPQSLLDNHKIAIFDTNRFNVTTSFEASIVRMTPVNHGFNNPAWELDYFVLFSKNLTSGSGMKFTLNNVL